ncbi:MAG: ClpP family protease [Gammaproteobacteria bacterium]
MAKKQKTVYIKLFGMVDAGSTNALMNIVDKKLEKGVERLVMLISSPGGSVFHGLSIYNYLMGIPAQIETHNFGSVHSIAVAIYLAGKKRYCVTNARYLIHPVAFFTTNEKYEEKQLEERLKGIRIDDENIASLIAQRTGKKTKEIIEAMRERTTLNAEQAIAFGLAHKVQNVLFPPGAELLAINMS